MWSLSAKETDELAGIYVSSDRSRMSVLYLLPIERLTAIFRDIGCKDIVRKDLVRGDDGQFRATKIEGRLIDVS